MAIARSTYVLLAIAIVVAIAALAGQRPEDGVPDTLLGIEEADIEAVTIDSGDRTLALERREDGWQMLQPEVVPAETGTVVFLLNLLATEPHQEPLTIAPSEAAEFGFAAPLGEIDVAAEGNRYQIVLGDYDFSNQSIYALVTGIPDSADLDGDLPVYLVSPNFEAAIAQPLEAWKAAEGAAPVPSVPASPAPP